MCIRHCENSHCNTLSARCVYVTVRTPTVIRCQLDVYTRNGVLLNNKNSDCDFWISCSQCSFCRNTLEWHPSMDTLSRVYKHSNEELFATHYDSVRPMTCLCTHRRDMEVWLHPICDLGAGWVWVDSTMPNLLYPPRNRPSSHCTGGWVGLGASLNGHGKSRHDQPLIPRMSSP